MKGYLKILEAARFMGVTPQTMRNWDKQGKLSPSRHPMNNYRMYKQTELEKILKKVGKK
mgnify:CR=1 FL=1